MKLIFELVASDVNVAVELQKQRDLVKQLNKEYKASTAPDDQKRLVNELAKSKVAISDLTKEQRKLNAEFKATQVPSDSIAGLRLEYSKLTNQINNQSKAERESDLGANIIKKAAGVKTQIDAVEQSVGRFTGNVGNYKSALLGVGDALTGGLATGGVVAGITAVIAVMKLGIDTALDYEKALDDLSALTGATGADLQGLEDVATSLKTISINGVEVVSTGAEILNALKLVGGAKPDLLENAEALGEVTRQAIILSKASGDTLENSVIALTTVLGQFNLEGDESARVINELAAGAKFGSSEIPQTTEALQKFGAIAKISNISTSESIALTELLATKQLKGAEAGTALKTVLARLASADVLPPDAQKAFAKFGVSVNVLKDQTIPLSERLKELGKVTGDVSALTAIFGVDQLAAGAIIAEGAAEFEALQKEIYGTSEAYTAAAIRADNATTAFQNLRNKGINELQETFVLLTPALSSAAKGLSFLFDQVDIGAVAFKTIAGNMGFFVDVMKAIGLTSKEAKKEIKITNEEFEKLTFGKQITGEGDPLLSSIKERAKAAKILSDALNEGSKKEESKVKKTKKEADAAVGSIDFLQKKVSDLKSLLESSTPDQIPRILGNLTAAEKELKILEDQVERLRNKAIGQDSKLTDPLTGLPSPELAGQVQSEVNDAKLKEIKKFNDQVIKDDEKLKEERLKAAVKEEEEKERGKQLIRDAAYQAGQQTISALADLAVQKTDDEKSAKLTALDEQYAKDKDLAAGNAAQLLKIDKDYQKKKEKIEVEAAKERKRIALVEGAIQGALAIIKGFATGGPAGAIAAGILVAIQEGIIATKKFAVGGFTGKGNRTDDTGERVVNAQLHEGEYVAPRSQVEQFPHLFKMLDMRRTKRGASTGIGYAVGGFNVAPAVSFGSQQAQQNQTVHVTAAATISESNVQMIADLVAKAVYSATASGINDADRTNERKQTLETFTNV